MKRIILLFFLAFTILNFQFSISFAQSWKELMDSTKFYQEKQDFNTALKWSKLALPQAKKKFGEQDTNYAASIGSIAELYYYSGSWILQFFIRK